MNHMFLLRLYHTCSQTHHTVCKFLSQKVYLLRIQCLKTIPSLNSPIILCTATLFRQASLSMSKICLIFHSMSQLASVALLDKWKNGKT